MEPTCYPGINLTRVVELNTGVYRVGGLHSQEFEIMSRIPNVPKEVIDQIVAHAAQGAIETARAEGEEYEYLGYQFQIVDGVLDGCFVFALPGDYQKIAEAGADYGMEMIGRASLAIAP